MSIQKEFGLIGYPLTHAFSQRYFSRKFRQEGLQEYSYANHPLNDIARLPHLIEAHPLLAGLNVTIPYKEAVIPYLDTMDPLAADVGAVNTITIDRTPGKPVLKGFNTDVEGFANALELMPGSGYDHALVLGTGGASKAVHYALNQVCREVLLVSRSATGPGIIHYSDLNEPLMTRFRLIVNTTPLGTWPEINASPPIPYEMITENHFLYDLVYNPAMTRFLKLGQEQGARVSNGLKMLELQAEASWKIWMTGS